MRHMQSLPRTADADPVRGLPAPGRGRLHLRPVLPRRILQAALRRTGLDQETLAYLIRQKDNWAWTIWTEANLQNCYTETQWLPKLDYYRLGDSLLGNLLHLLPAHRASTTRTRTRRAR